MSAQAEIAAIIAEADSIVSYNYCSMAGFVLYLYDYLITFPTEVACFWKARPTGATVLFFLTRYITMTVFLLEFALGFITFTGTSCVVPSKLENFIETMQYLPWAGFSALRAYALSRNRPLSVLVFVLSIVPIAVNLVDEFMFVKPAVLPSTSSICNLDITASPQTIIRFAIASRVCLIAADAILIVITWVKLSRRRGGDGSGGSFVHVLLRDGTLYFICLLVLNTLHLSFTVASIATPAGRQDSNVITFSEPLTAILVTRFMLNLQAVNRKALQLEGSGATTSSSGSCGGSLVFERVVGSLGASVLDDRELEEEVGDENKDQ